MRPWEDDDALLAELGEAVRDGAEVPERFVAAGKAAYTWRVVDAELARLVADSAVEPAGAGLRSGATGPRWLTFAGGALTIELEVRGDVLQGQLVPPQPATVQVEGREAGSTATADDVGYFTVAPLPAGPIRLRVRPAAGGPVVTAWFTP